MNSQAVPRTSHPGNGGKIAENFCSLECSGVTIAGAKVEWEGVGEVVAAVSFLGWDPNEDELRALNSLQAYLHRYGVEAVGVSPTQTGRFGYVWENSCGNVSGHRGPYNTRLRTRNCHCIYTVVGSHPKRYTMPHETRRYAGRTF